MGEQFEEYLEIFRRWWRSENKQAKKEREEKALRVAQYFAEKGTKKEVVISHLLRSGLVFSRGEGQVFYNRAIATRTIGITAKDWRTDKPKVKNAWPKIKNRLQKEGLSSALIETVRQRYGGEIVRYLKERGRTGTQIAERLRWEGFSKPEVYDLLANEEFHRFRVTFPDGRVEEYSRKGLENLKPREVSKGTKTKTLPFFYTAILSPGGISVSKVPLQALKQHPQRSSFGDLATVPSLLQNSIRLRMRGRKEKEAVEALGRMGNLDLDFLEWPDLASEYKGLGGKILYLIDRWGAFIEPHMGTLLLIIAGLFVSAMMWLALDALLRRFG